MKNFFTLASMVILITMTCCQTKHEEKEVKDNFIVTSPIIKDTLTTREYVCQIRAIQHIELRALEKGYLQEIFIDEGKPVKKGQLMFRIMPLMYQAELRQAQAEANYAEVEYKNAKVLADSSVISNNQLALIKAKFDKAKAELSLAEVRLGFTEIRAPFDGLMDRYHVQLGSLVDEGDLLTTLSDIGNLWVYFNIPEAEYLDYKTSTSSSDIMTVHLKMANNKLFNTTGIVKTIEADFNNETGNIAFRATFPNPEGLLRHGETGNVLVKVPVKKAMIIPQKATFEVLDKKYVYVLDKDNRLKSRKIEVGAELSDLFIIKSGLKATDKILLEGIRKVKENDQIKYTFQEPASVLKSLKLHAE